MKVVVLGASDKADRYSNKAVLKLKECNYDVLPVNTAGKVIHGIQSIKNLSDINDSFHTLTFYVNPKISDSLESQILALDFKRAIFNPGTENDGLEKKLEEKGVEVLRACTLVMLSTEQF